MIKFSRARNAKEVNTATICSFNSKSEPKQSHAKLERFAGFEFILFGLLLNEKMKIFVFYLSQKANSPNGTYRGCGTRECLMSPGQFGSNSKIDETFFEDNMCCIENKCNKGSTHFYLPSYLLLSKVLLTVLVVKLF